MDRFFVFLVVHDDDSANQEADCQCSKDVIPAIQSLVKDLLAFCDQDENSPNDLENTQLLLFDPLLALKNFTPTIHFSIVDDKPFSDQIEFYSKWHRGEHLKEVLSLLEKPVNDKNKKPNEMSCYGDVEISERLHQLADGLPDQAGVPVDVFWFICGKNTVSIRSHLHLFGALKRMQQWHNANITVLCSNEFDRSSFVKSWQKGLKLSVTQLNRNEIATKLFNPSVVWQGSLVFCEGQSPRTELPGFKLCCERSKKKIEPNSSQLHRKRNKKRSTDVENRLCIAPEITILCKVQKRTVPFHMFLSVRLGLSLDYSSPKLSTRLVEWLSLEVNEDIALIGSLQLVTPSKHGCMKGKNKEAWFNFVKSQNHSVTNKLDSKDGDEDRESCRRVCLIYGSSEKELSLYVLRPPEQLNGWLQRELSSIHSSLLMSNDQEVGGPLRFPDLTDMSLFETTEFDRSTARKVTAGTEFR
ncbi:hypothetical protein OS493_010041 [Desmophyllum pertusum]|uniref:DM2 domain-containing protein n=1 Tax=Desmophyllum pertusum TaxID=174260 RepID=A0A9W9YEF3_9CNID|nr:hypothetical protein OS493_010041 [Desmophyllum pertusum]